VSPTKNQRSTNIVSPAMRSTRILCVAKPATMIRNEAPAIAVRRSTPPVNWPIERTIAVPKAT
jgi:hypothetical protein